MNSKRISHFGSVIFSLLLFALSLWTISQELHQHPASEIGKSLAAIPASRLLLAAFLTGLNYLVMAGYDTIAVRYIRHPLPYQKTAIAAVITYGISNSVGLALLSGSAIRYRLYRHWGLSVIEIAHIVTFCNLSFWLGLFVVGGIIFLLEPVAVPQLLHLPFTSVRPVGAIFLLVVLGYLLVTVFRQKSLRLGKLILPHLPIHLSLEQLAIGACDWMLAAAVFYALFPSDITLSYPAFFGVYLLAQIAGVISNVPGGLGVFETVMLLLLSPPIPSVKLLGLLLAYRVIYYFLPLGTAALLLGGYELRQRFLLKN
jgi:uncharacterized membrane protein YbhN (UPF0104 family)